MLAIGITVTAAPAPKPAAVRPAARPRLSGNHLSAVPTQGSCTYSAPNVVCDLGALANGASVIFVSHDIDEVLEITDRATVLRDGRVAGVLTTADATRDSVVGMIVGRQLQVASSRRMTEASIKERC